MGAAITNVQHNSCGKAPRVQRKHSLSVKEDLRHVKGFKEELSSPDSIFYWIVWRLSQKDWVFLWVAFEIFKHVPPYCFHFIPVLNDTMFDGVTQFDQPFVFFLQVVRHRASDLQLLNQ